MQYIIVVTFMLYKKHKKKHQHYDSFTTVLASLVHVFVTYYKPIAYSLVQTNLCYTFWFQPQLQIPNITKF